MALLIPPLPPQVQAAPSPSQPLATAKKLQPKSLLELALGTASRSLHLESVLFALHEIPYSALIQIFLLLEKEGRLNSFTKHIFRDIGFSFPNRNCFKPFTRNLESEFVTCFVNSPAIQHVCFGTIEGVSSNIWKIQSCSAGFDILPEEMNELTLRSYGIKGTAIICGVKYICFSLGHSTFGGLSLKRDPASGNKTGVIIHADTSAYSKAKTFVVAITSPAQEVEARLLISKACEEIEQALIVMRDFHTYVCSSDSK